MKAQITGVLVVCAVAAAIAASGGGQGGAQTPPDIEALKQQIGALEKRVAALEGRLSEDPERVEGRRQPPAGAFVIPPVTPSPPALPRGWLQKEFNGMPYYLVPAREVPAVPPQPVR